MSSSPKPTNEEIFSQIDLGLSEYQAKAVMLFLEQSRALGFQEGLETGREVVRSVFSELRQKGVTEVIA